MGIAPMQAGQKQAFSIAYNVRQRVGKKEPRHEEDMGREYMKPHEGAQTDDENEDLHPERDSPTIAKSAVEADQRLDHRELAHGQVPQPAEPKTYYQSRGVDPNIRPEPDSAQVKFDEGVETDHFAMGGEVRSAMSRRERALYAARGQPTRPNDDHAVKSPGVRDFANEGASRSIGPSGQTTRMPATAGNSPPSRMSPDEQAMFAEGGEAGGGIMDSVMKLAPLLLMANKGGKVSHDEIAPHVLKLAKHYADGGYSLGADTDLGHAKFAEPMNQAPDLKEKPAKEGSKAADSGSGALKEGFADFTKGAAGAAGVGKAKKMAAGGYAAPHLDSEEQGAFYSGGGKAIAGRIRAKKMADGGAVHEDDDRPEDGDSIDNFRRADHPDNDFLADEEQTDYHHLNAGDLDEESEKPRRKGMLDRIMRGIHAQNGNR